MSVIHRLIVGWFAVAPLVAGCTSMSTTNTARTVTEQLLISNAIDTTLNKVNFTPFAGSKVYLDEKYIDAVDSKYLVASVRHRMLHAGAQLVDTADAADVVVEMRSGGIGTSSASSFIGMPAIALPGMLSIPEIKLVERQRQIGSAKVGLVAYDPESRSILGEGGVALSQSDDSNWFVAGVGPWQTGTVRNEVDDRMAVEPTFKPQELPRQVAFEGARRMPAAVPDADVQYAAWPETDAAATEPAGQASP
jgi:hypothetical protein